MGQRGWVLVMRGLKKVYPGRIKREKKRVEIGGSDHRETLYVEMSKQLGGSLTPEA